MNRPPALLELLPHDAPMAMVDELIDVGGEHIHCRTVITDRHVFFDNVLRSVPGYVGIEIMAQSVAGWAGYHAWCEGRKPAIGFLLGTRRYHSEVAVFAEHSVLDIYGERLMENKGMAAFRCRIEHNGEVIAHCQLNTYVPSPELLASGVTE
ncbi:hotdog family protein [Photobacterium nomapromontoriensis]|uniref:hotdog family protein n=1 Tax=Photobacterium nomapromontoriensis TaxID=2910237 RepID=UPI003D0AB2B8